ncbi:microtubule-associated protein tau isoform X2 [Diabrotica virgifera virgifera]|uniref:Microtubule-associated protein n=1 Tax=Diabrotica virgifera virgifera TaxID=50390 RepID=A0ABM5K8C3_DIAVI|nr:microtubule-associated protein tau isoform X2 [Diabrotica virgifera virgifera]
MSQQPLLNGPTAEFNTSKDEVKEMPKAQQNGNGSQPFQLPGGTPINVQRPLNRNDSKSNFPYRPPFPNQPGGNPPRPPPVRPPGPQQFIPPRSPLPPGQRPPGTPQHPPGQGPPPGQPFPANQPRANFRPFSPFPRPGVPNQRPPGVFQQRSVPSFGNVRPSVPEEGIVRSQTLDTTEIDHSKNDEPKSNTSHDYVKTPSIAAMNNRSYSLSSNAPEIALDSKEDARRKSVSSVDSYGEGRPPSRPSSRQGFGSNENLETKEESSSRPESRPMSRMNKIVEDEDRSPSSLTDVSQKSNDLTPNDNSKSKSPQPVISKTPDLTASRPPSGANLTNGTKTMNDKHLHLNTTSTRPKSSTKGDNDSGVDESTQGNDQSSNGDNRSPRKSSKSRTSTSTPVARSLSRGSKSPSLKSPDSNVTTPGSATEKKKLPMNKVQVGHAPSPNLKVVKSKIGSLGNTNYKPGGGNVKIENKKLEFKVAPRIEAKNDRYTPKGGEKKIVSQKLQWNAKSKIGSLENTTHKPKGGDKKIESMKLDFKEKAKSKVGSKDNIKHQPGGGDIKIENKKIELKVQSKIGSLDNVKHRPGGGDKKIFDDKEYLRQTSGGSMDQSLSASQNSIPSQPDKVPIADENLNQEH